MTTTEAGLNSNYRPTASSACVNAGYNGLAASEDLDGNKRIMGGTVDIGCYEYLPVYAETRTSGKTRIWWEDAGVASYTVQYRIMGTDKWTTKTVKNQTEVTLSLKNNEIYDVRVTPEGMNPENSDYILCGTLAKIGVKVASKTDNSVSFKLSNLCGILDTRWTIGIQEPNEEMEYFKFYYATSRLQYSGLTYTWDGGDVLTIKGLKSNTKYNFEFLQSSIGSTNTSISTPASVSVVTNKPVYTQTIVVKSATQTALKNAINQAPEGALITFDQSLSGASITLSQAITLSRGVTIDASNLKKITFVRNNSNAASDGNYKAFLVTGNSTVKFVGITFKENVGYVADEDGEISSPYVGIETQSFKGTLIVEGCVFSGNCNRFILSKDSSSIVVRKTDFYTKFYAVNYCINKSGGKLWVDDCYFEASCWRHIGGFNGASIAVTRTCFTENVPYGTYSGQAQVFGLSGANLEVSDCEFSHCYKLLDGANNCNISIKDSIFEYCGNFRNGNIVLTGCRFLNNNGNLFNGATVKCISCLFKDNKGNLFNGPDLKCYSTIFDGNKGTSSEQPVFNLSSREGTFVNCTFKNNTGSVFAGNGSSKIYVRNTITDKSYNTSGFATSSWINCIVTSVNSKYYPTDSSRTINKGKNTYYPTSAEYRTDYYGNPRTAGGIIDIGAVELYNVKVRSTTSNKVVISWDDYGVESYTVKYRPVGTENWTTKVVKGKTSLSLSVKTNQQYEVYVIPQGMEKVESSCVSTVAVAVNKLTAKVTSTAKNSISLQISQIAALPDMGFTIGIKKQNEKTYTYYDFYQGNSGSLGSSSMTYTFNNSGVLTIKGLDSSTKYNFQLAQVFDGGTWWDLHSVSPYLNVNVATIG